MYQQSEAAVHAEILDEDPAHPGKCYRKEDSKAYDVGSVWSVPEICEEHSCDRAPKGKYIISGRGCGVVATEPPCKVVRDMNLPYPDCCPRTECPEQTKKA